MANHVGEKVYVNYAAQKPNPRQGGAIYWKEYGRGNVFCEGPTLYSYGYHFPLAELIGTENPGTDKVQRIFVKNGDRYSATTSGHQSATQSACVGPTVSRESLRAAGIEFTRLTLKKRKNLEPHVRPHDANPPVILDWRADTRDHVYYDKKSKKYYVEEYTMSKRRKVFTPPAQGQFVPMHYPTGERDDEVVRGYWHILGACLIEHDGKQYLCALDSGSYFVAELSKPVKNVVEAFESLKPPEVRKAGREGKEILRQGEWFFVATGLDDKDMAQKFGMTKKAFLETVKVTDLPRQTPESNRHECRQFISINPKTEKVTTFARGKVFHRSPWTGSPNAGHPTLNLGDKWYEVYRNTEVRSWSFQGRFD